MEIKKHITVPFIGLLLLLLCACSEDQLSEIGDPELLVRIPETAPTFAYPNKPLSFLVEIEAQAGIDKVLTKVGFEELTDTEDASFEGNVGTYEFSYTPKSEEIGQTLEFIIVAYDKAGFTATSTYKVDIIAEPVNINITLPDVLPETKEFEDVLNFDISVTSEDEIATIETLLGGAVLEDLTMDSFENAYSVTYQFEYTIKAEDIGKNATFTFKVTDVEGKSEQVDYTLFIEGARVPEPLVLHENLTIGFQENTLVGQFIDFEESTIYTVPDASDNSAKVDMGIYLSGGVTGINIFAPTFSNAAQYIYNPSKWGEDNMGSWPVRNNTEFINLTPDLMSVAEYQALTDDELIAEIFEGNTPTINIAAIDTDQLIGFKTVDGIYGIIHVKGFEGPNTGTFTFDYKIGN